MSDQEELRFRKTPYGSRRRLTLGDFFSAGRTMHDDLRPAEKVAGTLLVALVSICGSGFLWSLQKHLEQTGDRMDTEAQAERTHSVVWIGGT
jgi:hypothetical protein